MRSRGLCPPSRWDAWANPKKLPRRRCFWHRMTPVSSPASNYSLMAAERKSNRRIGVGSTVENMLMTGSTIKIAVLDDYQNISLRMADWSSIPGNPEIRVFNDHISDVNSLVERLLP